MARKKIRLDAILVSRGLCFTTQEAQALIMTGKVFVDGRPITKPGSAINLESAIALKRIRSRFATRGGYKLEKALRSFSVPVSSRIVLDAGAAAGGFTDCLLQQGARRVYAVDAGYGQMKGGLAADPRVVNLERTNISDLTLNIFEEPIDLCVVDLSYLSLVKAVPIVRRLFIKPYEIICLIKPSYEGLPPNSKDDPGALHLTIAKLFHELAAEGLGPCDATCSPILGTRESIEFLCVIRQHCQASDPDALAIKAIEALRAEPPIPFEVAA